MLAGPRMSARRRVLRAMAASANLRIAPGDGVSKRRENDTVAIFHPTAVVATSSAHHQGADDVQGDCRVCPLRSRCITYGWMSPGGIWFENTVVLRPTPGCRGYEGRGAEILGHFGEKVDDEAPDRQC